MIGAAPSLVADDVARREPPKDCVSGTEAPNDERGFMLDTRVTGMLATTVLGLLAHASAAGSQNVVEATYARPQHLVAVDGKRRLNLICLGHGAPVVIFLSGLGSGPIDWRRVQPAIGRDTEACAYDRAGYGFSDAADGPSDATHAIADLHALLGAAHLTTPVVLVGHSLGGLFATHFALTYPTMVNGLVLVDPAFSGQSKAIADALGPRTARKEAALQQQTLASLDRCISLARRGLLSLPAEAKSDCLDNPPDPDPVVHRERTRESKRAAYQVAIDSEFRNASVVGTNGRTTDDDETSNDDASLGSMPLVVLTRGNKNDAPGLTPSEVNRSEAAWRAGHDRLAALSSNGTNIIVPHAGHFIQLDQPKTVIAQIERVLAKIRTQR